jgi:hypothetical protein
LALQKRIEINHEAIADTRNDCRRANNAMPPPVVEEDLVLWSGGILFF